jgi:hypothetical protein
MGSILPWTRSLRLRHQKKEKKKKKKEKARGDSRSGVSWSLNFYIQTRSMDPCPTPAYHAIRCMPRWSADCRVCRTTNYGRPEPADWRVVGRHRKTIARQSQHNRKTVERQFLHSHNSKYSSHGIRVQRNGKNAVCCDGQPLGTSHMAPSRCG